MKNIIDTPVKKAFVHKMYSQEEGIILNSPFKSMVDEIAADCKVEYAVAIGEIQQVIAWREGLSGSFLTTRDRRLAKLDYLPFEIDYLQQRAAENIQIFKDGNRWVAKIHRFDASDSHMIKKADTLTHCVDKVWAWIYNCKLRAKADMKQYILDGYVEDEEKAEKMMFEPLAAYAWAYWSTQDIKADEWAVVINSEYHAWNRVQVVKVDRLEQSENRKQWFVLERGLKREGSYGRKWKWQRIVDAKAALRKAADNLKMAYDHYELQVKEYESTKQLHDAEMTEVVNDYIKSC